MEKQIDIFSSLSINDYVKNIMNKLKLNQKFSFDLQGWEHYRDYNGVNRTMELVRKQVMSLIEQIFIHQDIKIKLDNKSLQHQLDIIKEGNDALLERVSSDIDEASGVKKDNNALMVDMTIRKVELSTVGGKERILLAPKNIQKPQIFFKDKIDNSPEAFIPLVKEKPNSLKPLSILICLDENGKEYYSHPYEYELQHWSIPATQLQERSAIKPNPLLETPCLIVDSVDSLKNAVSELLRCTEIAVDVEISSREKDYIIDCLALRGELGILNEVFTHSKILKVFHGATFDIIWLQRCCGIYVVNMFDTFHAANILEYGSKSLASLLSHFCGIHANKIYQRADWRVRPLPEDFIRYAKEDTHYLLYIYDLLCNELIAKGNNFNNLLYAVYDRSKELCLKRFEKPVCGPNSHMDMYYKSHKHFNHRQMFALKQLYLWRDKFAREHDESVEYVLPKHMLLQIADVLPKEVQGILACCNPIPSTVKTELLTLHSIIREALKQPLLKIDKLSNESTFSFVKSYHLDSFISKHDLSHADEVSSCLPKESLAFLPSEKFTCLKKKAVLFNCSKKKLKRKEQHLDVKTDLFQSPYERYCNYLEMRPFIEATQKQKDEQRINNIKEHYKSLLNSTEVVSSESSENKDNLEMSESDIKRMERIQQLFATLTENTVYPEEEKQEQEPSNVASCPQKRKSDAEIVIKEAPKQSRGGKMRTFSFKNRGKRSV